MNKIEKNFLARGCTKVPKSHQHNNDVFKHQCCKLDVYDWLSHIHPPQTSKSPPLVEVRFKNNRKDFFRCPSDIQLVIGDIVAVESSPGHDIGIVSLTGELVKVQMVKKGANPNSDDIKKVYRKARPTDIETWIGAAELEESTLFKTRKIKGELGLLMKINDIEFQGDKTKAIFYYTADDRIDFRELIKILAERFMVRIEMKQIGARQEASRLGGMASCGRELCCSSWLTNFQSVSTESARLQQLTLNPQKLAGQCGKLKCCLNYEYDVYMDTIKDFPDTHIDLFTKKGKAVHRKTDIFKKIYWYSYKEEMGNFIPISVENVIHIQKMNAKKQYPANLEDFVQKVEKVSTFESVVGQDELTRFDKS